MYVIVKYNEAILIGDTKMELTFLGYEEDLTVIKSECNDGIEVYHFDSVEQNDIDLPELENFKLN